jgi:hypothetical protein
LSLLQNLFLFVGVKGFGLSKLPNYDDLKVTDLSTAVIAINTCMGPKHALSQDQIDDIQRAYFQFKYHRVWPGGCDTISSTENLKHQPFNHLVHSDLEWIQIYDKTFYAELSNEIKYNTSVELYCHHPCIPCSNLAPSLPQVPELAAVPTTTSFCANAVTFQPNNPNHFINERGPLLGTTTRTAKGSTSSAFTDSSPSASNTAHNAQSPATTPPTAKGSTAALADLRAQSAQGQTSTASTPSCLRPPKKLVPDTVSMYGNDLSEYVETMTENTHFLQNFPTRIRELDAEKLQKVLEDYPPVRFKNPCANVCAGNSATQFLLHTPGLVLKAVKYAQANPDRLTTLDRSFLFTAVKYIEAVKENRKGDARTFVADIFKIMPRPSDKDAATYLGQNECANEILSFVLNNTNLPFMLGGNFCHQITRTCNGCGYSSLRVETQEFYLYIQAESSELSTAIKNAFKVSCDSCETCKGKGISAGSTVTTQLVGAPKTLTVQVHGSFSARVGNYKISIDEKSPICLVNTDGVSVWYTPSTVLAQGNSHWKPFVKKMEAWNELCDLDNSIVSRPLTIGGRGLQLPTSPNIIQLVKCEKPSTATPVSTAAAIPTYAEKLVATNAAPTTTARVPTSADGTTAFPQGRTRGVTGSVSSRVSSTPQLPPSHSKERDRGIGTAKVGDDTLRTAQVTEKNLWNSTDEDTCAPAIGDGDPSSLPPHGHQAAFCLNLLGQRGPIQHAYQGTKKSTITATSTAFFIGSPVNVLSDPDQNGVVETRDGIITGFTYDESDLFITESSPIPKSAPSAPIMPDKVSYQVHLVTSVNGAIKISGTAKVTARYLTKRSTATHSKKRKRRRRQSAAGAAENNTSAAADDDSHRSGFSATDSDVDSSDNGSEMDTDTCSDNGGDTDIIDAGIVDIEVGSNNDSHAAVPRASGTTNLPRRQSSMPEYFKPPTPPTPPPSPPPKRGRPKKKNKIDRARPNCNTTLPPTSAVTASTKTLKMIQKSIIAPADLDQCKLKRVLFIYL